MDGGAKFLEVDQSFENPQFATQEICDRNWCEQNKDRIICEQVINKFHKSSSLLGNLMMTNRVKGLIISDDNFQY